VLTTPIDAHLPLVIAAVLACAWAARGTGWSAAVQCAIPLLLVAMMTLTDERTRLLAYGVIVSAAFAVAAAATARVPERRRHAGWTGGVSPPTVVLAIAGVILLRWIPFRDLHAVKEVIVLIGSIALLFAIQRRDAAEPAGGTPALLAVLVLAAITPMPPGKMALLPLTVAVLMLAVRAVFARRETAKPRDLATASIGTALLAAACSARYSLATLYIAVAIVFLLPLAGRIKPLAYAAAIAIFALWPWSGIIARALPIVRNYEPAPGDVRSIARALAPSEGMAIDVPAHVRHVVVTMSGAQMARFKPGRVVGTLEAIDARGRTMTRPITIGDIADFGFTRREQFFASRNPLPRFSPGEIRDYGANAWIWGAGRSAIACAADIRSLRVIAASNLPAQSHLQVDAVEFPPR
jgi:hypothetical protein